MIYACCVTTLDLDYLSSGEFVFAVASDISKNGCEVDEAGLKGGLKLEGRVKLTFGKLLHGLFVTQLTFKR